MSDKKIGSNGEKVIVFYTFSRKNEFDEFVKSMETLINKTILNSTVFIVFLDKDEEKNGLPDSERFNYISKTDFNLFKQLKNKEIRSKLKENFDVLLVFSDVNERFVKLVNKVKSKKRIVSSLTKELKFDIRLNSNSNRIEQIASFVKETLEKIQS